MSSNENKGLTGKVLPKRQNELFEEFKRNYNSIGEVSEHIEETIKKTLSHSEKLSSSDKMVLTVFQSQTKMVSDALRKSLVNEYKTSYLEDAIEGLYSILKDTLKKIDCNMTNVNGEMKKIKATLNNPMYARIDEFIQIVAEKEKQKQGSQKEQRQGSGVYIA